MSYNFSFVKKKVMISEKKLYILYVWNKLTSI